MTLDAVTKGSIIKSQESLAGFVLSEAVWAIPCSRNLLLLAEADIPKPDVAGRGTSSPLHSTWREVQVVEGA